MQQEEKKKKKKSQTHFVFLLFFFLINKVTRYSVINHWYILKVYLDTAYFTETEKLLLM